MKLNYWIEAEISRIASSDGIDSAVLEKLAQFVIENYRKKPPKPPKKLTLPQIKAAIFGKFGVKDVKELKASSEFVMGTNGMNINLSKKDAWERLYRKFIGILPGEDGEVGPNCINGINIFNYSLPWRTFGLDAKTAKTEDVKEAYRNLCKIYHPDIPGTGNPEIFDRLTVFCNSLTEKF